MCSKNRLNHISRSRSSRDIGKTHTYKKNQRTHKLTPKVNLLCHDGTKISGFAINKFGDMMEVELLDENDNMFVISVPAPEWDDESNCCVHEHMHALSGHKLILFEPIVLRFKKLIALVTFGSLIIAAQK